MLERRGPRKSHEALTVGAATAAAARATMKIERRFVRMVMKRREG